jgi:hypothetical protein
VAGADLDDGPREPVEQLVAVLGGAGAIRLRGEARVHPREARGRQVGRRHGA